MTQLIHQDPETATILLCAIRYSMGRQTYMPSLVQEWAMRHWDKLPLNGKSVILRDVRRAVQQHSDGIMSLGQDCDVRDWQAFLA